MAFHMELAALWLTLGLSALHRPITSSVLRLLIRQHSVPDGCSPGRPLLPQENIPQVSWQVCVPGMNVHF